MASITYIARPVIAEPWVDELNAFGREALCGMVDLYPPEQIRQPALSPYETDHIPSFHRGHVAVIREKLNKLRQTQSELTVPTTKVLIKWGEVLIGLADNESLKADRAAAVDMLAKLASTCRYRVEPFRFNVRLGQLVDGSPRAYLDIIHGITDNVLPDQVRLGQTQAGFIVLSTGEQFVI